MWHYFWAHMVYHCARLCSRNRTRKCPLATLLIFITVITLAPQLWIIYIRDFYIMFCPFPIYNLVVASVVFTIFMIGFSVIFSIMEPVHQSVKYAFHVFGVADLIFELLFITYTFKSFVCAISATEMFVVCVLMSLGSLATLCEFTALTKSVLFI